MLAVLFRCEVVTKQILRDSIRFDKTVIFCARLSRGVVSAKLLVTLEFAEKSGIFC